MAARKPPYLWDYDLTEQFAQVLSGQITLGRLDRDWAAVRLLEHAPYAEIVRLLGFPGSWPAGRAGANVSALEAGGAAWTFWSNGCRSITPS